MFVVKLLLIVICKEKHAVKDDHKKNKCKNESTQAYSSDSSHSQGIVDNPRLIHNCCLIGVGVDIRRRRIICWRLHWIQIWILEILSIWRDVWSFDLVLAIICTSWDIRGRLIGWRTTLVLVLLGHFNLVFTVLKQMEDLNGNLSFEYYETSNVNKCLIKLNVKAYCLVRNFLNIKSYMLNLFYLADHMS